MRTLRLFATIVFVVGVAAISLFCLSYICAAKRADAFISKARPGYPFPRIGSRLSVVRSIMEHRGLTWDFTYDSDDFGTTDLTLEVNLWGTVVASNPESLLSRLQSLP